VGSLRSIHLNYNTRSESYARNYRLNLSLNKYVKLDWRWMLIEIQNADYTSNQIQSNLKSTSHYNQNYFHFRFIARVTYDVILY